MSMNVQTNRNRVPIYAYFWFKSTLPTTHTHTNIYSNTQRYKINIRLTLQMHKMYQTVERDRIINSSLQLHLIWLTSTVLLLLLPYSYWKPLNIIDWSRQTKIKEIILSTLTKNCTYYIIAIIWRVFANFFRHLCCCCLKTHAHEG